MRGCCHCIGVELPRRPVNGLCVEIGVPTLRCMLKPPPEWVDREPETGPSLVDRWILSGGSPLILGVCDAYCPREN